MPEDHQNEETASRRSLRCGSARRGPGYGRRLSVGAPKGTPKEIVAKLNGALRTALANPSTRKRLIDLAQEIFPPEEQSPEALRKFQQAEIDKWWPIIKEAGIKAQ